MRNPDVMLLKNILSQDLIRHLDKYFEHPKKKKTHPVSPSFQKQIMKIQSSPKFKTAMYMRGLEDFCLD
jgi:hypothetical protein